jgi:hypothetical protein
MRNFLAIPLFFILCSSPFARVLAHMQGAEISYKCTSTPGIYEITLVMYRDCAGIPVCVGGCGIACSRSLQIQSADPSCSSGNYGTITLNLTNVRDIGANPHCPSVTTMCTNTGCTTPGIIPGIERYEFKGLVNLGSTSGIPASCCNAKLSMGGCCRSTNGENFYIETIINRCVAPCNSSPEQSIDPLFYLGANKTYTYNPGAIDPDGDSLSFALVPSLKAAATPMTYPPPYTFSIPMPLVSPMYWNPNNGDLIFTPTPVASPFYGYLTYEIKQWVKINGTPTVAGITTRDIQFSLGGGGLNSLPTLVTVPPNPSAPSQPKADWVACAGDQLCFTITAKDQDTSDMTFLSWNGDSSMALLGATFLPTYEPAERNLPAPQGGPREDNYQFCWTPDSTVELDKPYYFTILAKDNKCYDYGQVSKAFSIRVVSKPYVSIVQNDLGCSKWKLSYQNIGPASLSTSTLWKISRFAGDFSFAQNPYIFPNATTTPPMSFTQPGKYLAQLEITSISSSGAGGCSVYAYDTLIIDTPISAIIRDTLVCPGDTVIISAEGKYGVAPYTYKWYNSIKDTALPALNAPSYTNSELSVVADTSRKYTILISDQSGCKTYNTLSVVRGTSVQNPVITHIVCPGTNTGIIDVKPTDNNSVYLYKLNNGSIQSSHLFDNLIAGTYNILVQDANSSCSRSFTDIIVTEPPALKDTLTTVSGETCFNSMDGSIITQGTGGGNPAYMYKIGLRNYTSSGSFRGLIPGTYPLYIKDGNGCVYSFNKTIAKTDSISHSVTKTNLSCFNAQNGVLAITATGGKAPYTFNIDNGSYSSSGTFNNLTAKLYQIKIKDKNECIKTFYEGLLQPPSLQYSSTKTDISCHNMDDGSITINATGGTPPYTYQVETGSFNGENIFTGLAGGTYTFTIKDNANCTQSLTATFNNPPPFNTNGISGQAAVLKNSTYTYSVPPVSGINYLWKAEKGTILSGQATPAAMVRWDSLGIGSIQMVLYKDSACADTVLQTIIIGTTGLDELAAQLGLHVFPNPVKNTLNITLEKLPADKTIILFDVQGRIVLEQPVKEQQQLNLEQLAQGVYTLKIGEWRGQIVKQ